jgi:hypothetical protein
MVWIVKRQLFPRSKFYYGGNSGFIYAELGGKNGVARIACCVYLTDCIDLLLGVIVIALLVRVSLYNWLALLVWVTSYCWLALVIWVSTKLWLASLYRVPGT